MSQLVPDQSVDGTSQMLDFDIASGTGPSNYWVFSRGVNTQTTDVNVTVNTADPQASNNHITVEVTATGDTETVLILPAHPNVSPMAEATKFLVKPGYSYTPSYYAKMGAEATAAFGNIRVDWYSEAGLGQGASAGSLEPLTSSYQKIVRGPYIAPSGAAYARFSFQASSIASAGTTTPEVHLDTFEILENAPAPSTGSSTTGGCYGLFGPFYFGRAYEHPPHFSWSMTTATVSVPDSDGQTTIKGRYDLNVSFEGQHLKSYAATHPIPHRSGPETLELTCLEWEDLQ